jgi:3-oxoacyl-[acyl-carrier-protein] synthase II
MLCVAIGDALGEASAAAPIDPIRLGLIVGMASGSLDGVARFLNKVRDKGPRLAPPADFPNLMLSAAGGHASIYHGLQGPVLSTTDAGMSMASALISALELVETSTTDCMLAAGVVEASHAQMSATRAVDPAPLHPLSEGASCVVLVDEAQCAGVAILWHAQWHDAAQRNRSLAEIPAPAIGARVVTAGPAASEDLKSTGWGSVDCVAIEDRAGAYEGVDGAAIVAAASLVSTGQCSQVLAVASLGARGCALLFGAP